MANFDKFYTKKEVAEKCYNFLIEKLPMIEDKLFLEPSAGNGVFLNYLKNYKAYDLIPENDNIVKQDFLTLNLENLDFITIGNPPFGNRSKLAIDFFNKASKNSEVIAFIVPVSFMKWSVQKELSKDFKLIDYFYLEPNSFLDRDKEFSVRTVFQIWIKNGGVYDSNKFEDLRLKKAPSIKHEDFNIWQYNATPQSLNVIDENWIIATYRQGYHNYNEVFSQKDKEYIRDKMTRKTGKQQFFFIEPLNDTSREIIKSMDFNALAERNTSTPGFGKGDFVSYYMELKKNFNF